MKKSIITILFFIVIIVIGLVNLKPTNYDEAMLLKAIEENDPGQAIVLISKINNPDIATVEGDTPLMLASAKGYDDLVKQLIESGADINKRDLKGYTPLMHAVENEHITTVELLLSYKPEYKSIVEDSETSLTIAAKKKNSHILKLLLQNMQKYKGSSEYIISMHIGKIMKAAAQAGDIDIINAIITGLGERKVSLMQAFETMNIAVENDNSSISNLIMANSDKINFNDRSASSALLVESARRGYFRLVKELIKNKGNINYQNSDGITPLMAAAQNGWDYSARILLEAGADTSLRSKDGLNALDYAILAGHKEVTDLIRNYTAK